MGVVEKLWVFETYWGYRSETEVDYSEGVVWDVSMAVLTRFLPRLSHHWNRLWLFWSYKLVRTKFTLTGSEYLILKKWSIPFYICKNQVPHLFFLLSSGLLDPVLRMCCWINLHSDFQWCWLPTWLSSAVSISSCVCNRVIISITLLQAPP